MNTERSATDELCQIETGLSGGSMRRPGFLYVPMRIFQNLRERGFRYTIRATFGPRRKASLGTHAAMEVNEPVEAILNLQPGELVEVKSLQEIQNTLDVKSKLRGLVFTPEMKKHCGRQYHVYKRLELMFDEYHKSQRRIKNTVLLEGVVCEGAGLGCHRSCFLYWREAWLRRVT